MIEGRIGGHLAPSRGASLFAAASGAEADLPTIAAAIVGMQRFLVTSHARPDGDAIGSALAFAEILRGLGKDCDVVLADPIPPVYATLPGVGLIRRMAEVDASSFDCVVILECDSTRRTGLRGLDDAVPLINIDHHMTGCNYAALNWIDDSAAAVGVLIYRLARYLDVPVTKDMATCLYTALLTDTGAFTYPGTANGSLQVAQELIACGADADAIARDVLYSVSVAHIRLLGVALSRMQLHGATAWSYISQEDLLAYSATEDDCEGTVDYLISIAGVDAALFLRELPTETGRQQAFRVSLRSKNGLDVASVAVEHGGGGHQRSAGCTLPGPLLDGVASVLSSIDRSRQNLT